MAIFDTIDTGPYSLTQGPSVGQEDGHFLIEGQGSIAWPRGKKLMTRTMTVNVEAPIPIGGFAAGTRGAVRLTVQQLVELANNPARQPCLVQWESGGGYVIANPWDGWWRLDSVVPLDWTYQGHVPCQLTATLVSLLGSPTSIAYMGGALPSNFSGAAINALALPVGATALEPALTRQTAEGPISCIFAPVASPEPFVPPTSLANLFKGGCHVYDTISTAAFGVPAGASIQTLFRSQGTDATGTLGAWTTVAGAPSIASNVVTAPANARLVAGHADWGDGTYGQRFRWVTGGGAEIFLHYVDQNNWVKLYVDGANIYLQKLIGGVQTTVVQIAAVLANTTNYWGTIQAIGSTYVISIYNDSAISLGSLIATVSGVITDAIVQTGKIGIGAAFQTILFGGAGSNVCQVTGPTPAGWVTVAFGGWTTVEPAFAWSQNAAYQGRCALSVYLNTTGLGYWTHSGLVSATASYTFGGAIRGVAMSGVGADFLLSNGAGTTLVLTGTPGWTIRMATANGSAGACEMQCRFQGPGTAYFDDITVFQGSTPFYGDGAEPDANANWVEVFGTDHDFQGECVVTNGLLLARFSLVSNGLVLYLWNTALAVATWQFISQLGYFDNAGTGDAMRDVSLTRVGLDECALDFDVSTTGSKIAKMRWRLQRGRYEYRIRHRPLVEATSATFQIPVYIAGGQPKITYNSGGVHDNVLGDAQAVPVADYGYGAAFRADVAFPVVQGWLYVNQPGQWQPFGSGVTGYLAPGDTTVLPINAEREYGFFALPYGVSGSYSPANLQVELETGTLDPGWSSVADAAASAGNTAKAASTTIAGKVAIAGAFPFVPAPGTYDVWFRVRVTTNVGSALEMTLGLWDVTASAYVPSGSTTFNRTAMGTTYAWVRAATGVTPTAAHNMQFRAVTALTLGTDWFIDEAVLVPKTLTADNRGPQDIFQQFMFDRTAELITA